MSACCHACAAEPRTPARPQSAPCAATRATPVTPRGQASLWRIGEETDRLEQAADLAMDLALGDAGAPAATPAGWTALPPAPASVDTVLARGGTPLPTATRAAFEARLGHDLAHVRIHHDPLAARSARELRALAYTAGHHVVFAAGRFAPHSADGQALLAHELAHVRQADGQTGAAPVLRRMSEARFRQRLGRTPDQAVVVAQLFAHPRFRALWDWLGRCRGQPADHGPIKLRVGRSFDDGVQTFGGFNQQRGILRINPMNRAARENPQELVDTLVHELVHAISWALRTGKCPGQEAPMPQVAELVDDEDRQRFAAPQPGYARTERIDLGEELERLERLGPSASDPCRYFLDIEAAPQARIVGITRDIQAETGIGAPTRTAVNQIIRNELRQARQRAGGSPEAILAAAPTTRAFMRCRDAECARPRRQQRIGRCFDAALHSAAQASEAATEATP